MVKKIVLKSSEIIYCVWVTRDAEEIGGHTVARSQAQLTLASHVSLPDTESLDTTEDAPDCKVGLISFIAFNLTENSLPESSVPFCVFESFECFQYTNVHGSNLEFQTNKSLPPK